MAVDSLRLQIIQKAWAEPAFKESLLSAPLKAIKEAFGVEFPAGVELKVVEESSSSYYLSLPRKPEEIAEGKSSPSYPW